MNFLQKLIGNILPQPQSNQITQKAVRVFIPPAQYQGTSTGYGPQSQNVVHINPNLKSPAYAGGLDVTQENTANGNGTFHFPQQQIPNGTLYNHPALTPVPVTLPKFQLPKWGSTVNLPTGPATAALPPQMVNVSWSNKPVTYAQSLKGPSK